MINFDQFFYDYKWVLITLLALILFLAMIKTGLAVYKQIRDWMKKQI